MRYNMKRTENMNGKGWMDEVKEIRSTSPCPELGVWRMRGGTLAMRC